MPMYDYECKECNKDWINFHVVDERGDEKCPCCKGEAIRLISSGPKPVVYNYYCDGIGAQITGPEQRAKLMKKKGLADAPPL